MTTTDTIRVDDLKAALEWLKWVAGVDDDHLARWDVAEWAQWYRAMDASIGDAVNPCVPSWINDIIRDDWSRDWSAPWPSIGQLWPTAHDWFVAAANHDDFVLKVAEADQDGEHHVSHLGQLDKAWWAAHETVGAAGLLQIDLLPPAPGTDVIIGEISAFYVVVNGEQDKLTQELHQLLGKSTGVDASTVNTWASKAWLFLTDQTRIGYQWNWTE